MPRAARLVVLAVGAGPPPARLTGAPRHAAARHVPKRGPACRPGRAGRVRPQLQLGAPRGAPCGAHRGALPVTGRRGGARHGVGAVPSRHGRGAVAGLCLAECGPPRRTPSTDAICNLHLLRPPG